MQGLPHRSLMVGLSLLFSVVTAFHNARSHHGLDFLMVQDAVVPPPGSGVFYGGFDWTQDKGAEIYYSEPGLMLGLLPGLAFGIGAETGDVGNGWQVYGLAPYLQMQLLPAEWSKRVRLALRVGYEFSITPYVSREVVAVTRTETVREMEALPVAGAPPARKPQRADGGGGNPQPCDPNAGPDAPCHQGQGGGGAQPKHAGHGPPPAARRSASTTRVQRTETRTSELQITTYEEVETRQRVEGVSARLMLEADLTGSDRLVLNVVHFNGSQEKPAWGYALGLRHAFHHDFAVSLEALGNFNQENFHQGVVAAHYAPVHWGLIKVGVGVGLTKETPDLSLIAGFVVRF